jgi:hypothetical protein
MSEIFRKIARQVINSDHFMQALEDQITEEVERALKAEAAGDRFYVAKQSREDVKKETN